MKTPPEVVLITGASSGIGYALSKEFAKENYTIVAVGRNKLKLEELVKDCSNVKVFILCKDLTDSDAVNVIMDFLSINNLSITTLVNNAGFGIWGAFSKVDINEQHKLIDLGVSFYLKLTHALLPTMLSQKRGRILNIGSVYSFSSVPNQSIYAASKAFLLSHTISLRDELESNNIKVCISCPGITNTAFRRSKKNSDKSLIFSKSAESVARITFKQFKKNKAIIVPGFINKFYCMFCKILPAQSIAKGIKLLNIFRKVYVK